MFTTARGRGERSRALRAHRRRRATAGRTAAGVRLRDLPAMARAGTTHVNFGDRLLGRRAPGRRARGRSPKAGKYRPASRSHRCGRFVRPGSLRLGRSECRQRLSRRSTAAISTTPGWRLPRLRTRDLPPADGAYRLPWAETSTLLPRRRTSARRRPLPAGRPSPARSTAVRQAFSACPGPRTSRPAGMSRPIPRPSDVALAAQLAAFRGHSRLEWRPSTCRQPGNQLMQLYPALTTA